jgi:hypothetical protein
MLDEKKVPAKTMAVAANNIHLYVLLSWGKAKQFLKDLFFMVEIRKG